MLTSGVQFLFNVKTMVTEDICGVSLQQTAGEYKGAFHLKAGNYWTVSGQVNANEALCLLGGWTVC